MEVVIGGEFIFLGILCTWSWYGIWSLRFKIYPKARQNNVMLSPRFHIPRTAINASTKFRSVFLGTAPLEALPRKFVNPNPFHFHKT